MKKKKLRKIALWLMVLSIVSVMLFLLACSLLKDFPDMDGILLLPMIGGFYGALYLFHASLFVGNEKKDNDIEKQKNFERAQKAAMDIVNKDKEMKKTHPKSSDEEVRVIKKNDNSKSKTSYQALNMSNFSFSDEERQKIKSVAIRYMPDDLSNPSVQLELLEMLSGVMDISVPKLKTEYDWRAAEHISDATEKEERLKKALVETILAVNQTFSYLKQQFLIEKVQNAKIEELLKGWLVLDYYAHVLKPEYTTNVQQFRDYIHNALLEHENNDDNIVPIKQEGHMIYFDSKELVKWKNNHPVSQQYEFIGNIPLSEKEPIISFYEDGIKTVEYCLQTEGTEDFSGKYFIISVRIGYTGNPLCPTMQMDGFISDTSEDRKMTSDDIGYRMEGHYLSCGGDITKQRRAMVKGQDLVAKGLKYQGYTTPTNIRLIGICPECKKSFAFHGYACYMGQNDVAYSDDGMDCCQVSAYSNIDKDNWSYETDGKIFRYYNSFNCPYCGTPYIDYKKYPENKEYGVLGCVHLGREIYTAEIEN